MKTTDFLWREPRIELVRCTGGKNEADDAHLAIETYLPPKDQMKDYYYGMKEFYPDDLLDYFKRAANINLRMRGLPCFLPTPSARNKPAVFDSFSGETAEPPSRPPSPPQRAGSSWARGAGGVAVLP